MADVSACSCGLPSGCWGIGGWHFQRADEAWLRQRVASTFPLEQRPHGESAAAAWEKRREGYAAFLRRYLGSIMAFEQCPPYLRAIEIHRRRERAEIEMERSGSVRF